jgi:hypothetical protein
MKMSPAATKKQSHAKVSENGLATVFVHRTVGAVSINGEEFARPGKADGRVWSFECSPEDARDLIDRYEFASGTESGVPLTVDEQSDLADLQSRSNIETAKFAQALASLAEDKVRRDEAQGDS